MNVSHSLTIGRLATVTGVNLETIRYYERIGLMPEPDRSQGGHRLYDPEHRRRLAFIRRGRELGFSIDGIRTLLELAQPQKRSCDEVRIIAAAHLEDVRTKIADLERLEVLLGETVRQCSPEGGAATCPVLDLLETET